MTPRVDFRFESVAQKDCPCVWCPHRWAPFYLACPWARDGRRVEKHLNFFLARAIIIIATRPHGAKNFLLNGEWGSGNAFVIGFVFLNFLKASIILRLHQQIKICHSVLGPKLLLPMGCVNLGEKIAFSCLLLVNKPQINYPISRNPWEVIISGPVESKLSVTHPSPRRDAEMADWSWSCTGNL